MNKDINYSFDLYSSITHAKGMEGLDVCQPLESISLGLTIQSHMHDLSSFPPSAFVFFPRTLLAASLNEISWDFILRLGGFVDRDCFSLGYLFDDHEATSCVPTHFSG